MVISFRRRSSPVCRSPAAPIAKKSSARSSPITPFDSEEEVIGYANDTDYGLASSVWTQNLNRAHRVAEQIHTGTVWVNCWLVRDLRVPFGGMKQSGVGREGGDEALRFFTEPKNVCIAK